MWTRGPRDTKQPRDRPRTLRRPRGCVEGGRAAAAGVPAQDSGRGVLPTAGVSDRAAREEQPAFRAGRGRKRPVRKCGRLFCLDRSAEVAAQRW